MANFAVIENNTIVNTIIADSKELAEQLTGKTCIDLLEIPGAGVGFLWSDDFEKYIPPKPYPSWTFDGYVWNAPVELIVTDPLTFINPIWDEDSLSWVEGNQ